MKFLDRNQYCIYFSRRCNYGCSYCINGASVDAPYSEVEEHTALLFHLLGNLEPGVVTVSGGEPLLWHALPQLISGSPHHWVILTNLSSTPDWIYHKRVKLVVAAYHEQFADKDAFIKRAKRLPRVVTKVLVDPRDDGGAVTNYLYLKNSGLNVHMAPVEWPRGYSPMFLDWMIGHALTSCMYNSRFFSSGVEAPRPCIAGTSDMFQINPSGSISRCSQAGEVYGASVFNPQFSDIPRMCSRSCYCEWHHWAGVTLAHDNHVWNHFVDTGEWLKPTQDEFEQFVEDMGWSL